MKDIFDMLTTDGAFEFIFYISHELQLFRITVGMEKRYLHSPSWGAV